MQTFRLSICRRKLSVVRINLTFEEDTRELRLLLLCKPLIARVTLSVFSGVGVGEEGALHWSLRSRVLHPVPLSPLCISSGAEVPKAPPLDGGWVYECRDRTMPPWKEHQQSVIWGIVGGLKSRKIVHLVRVHFPDNS